MPRPELDPSSSASSIGTIQDRSRSESPVETPVVGLFPPEESYDDMSLGNLFSGVVPAKSNRNLHGFYKNQYMRILELDLSFAIHNSLPQAPLSQPKLHIVTQNLPQALPQPNDLLSPGLDFSLASNEATPLTGFSEGAFFDLTPKPRPQSHFTSFESRFQDWPSLLLDLPPSPSAPALCFPVIPSFVGENDPAFAEERFDKCIDLNELIGSKKKKKRRIKKKSSKLGKALL